MVHHTGRYVEEAPHGDLGTSHPEPDLGAPGSRLPRGRTGRRGERSALCCSSKGSNTRHHIPGLDLELEAGGPETEPTKHKNEENKVAREEVHLHLVVLGGVREIWSVDLSLLVDGPQVCSSSSQQRFGSTFEMISSEFELLCCDSSLGGNKDGDKLKIIESEEELLY